MPSPVGKGAISVAFVCPSVCPIRPSLSVSKFGRKVPTFDATCILVLTSKGQRSGSPSQLMLTHIVRHIFRMARPTNFTLGIRMEDDDPQQPQAPWPPRSKVKVARSRDQSEPSWLNAVPRRPNSTATLLVSMDVLWFSYKFHSGYCLTTKN